MPGYEANEEEGVPSSPTAPCMPLLKLHAWSLVKGIHPEFPVSSQESKPGIPVFKA